MTLILCGMKGSVLVFEMAGDDRLSLTCSPPPQALELHSCPKPLVFVLHTFLSAKVTRLGLLA